MPQRRAKPRTPPRTAEQALRRLVSGNEVFVRMAEAEARGEHAVMQFDPGDLGFDSGRAPAQRPFAAVLGCADARVPVEMVFQQRSNDLFVVRVAGNGVELAGLGSLRYAVSHFSDSLHLIVVLGHSQCGAVTAATDAFLLPRNYLPLASDYPLRTLVDGMLVAVRAASLALEQAHGARVAREPGYRDALVETSVAMNAAFTAYSLQRELSASDCRVVFGRYDLASGRIGLPLRDGAGDGPCVLVPPPRDDEDFRRLGVGVARSAPVLSLLRARPGRR